MLTLVIPDALQKNIKVVIQSLVSSRASLQRSSLVVRVRILNVAVVNSIGQRSPRPCNGPNRLIANEVADRNPSGEFFYGHVHSKLEASF